MVFSEDFAISQGELRLSQLPDLDEDFYHFSHLDSATVGQTSEVAQHIHEIDTKVSFFDFFFKKITSPSFSKWAYSTRTTVAGLSTQFT